MNNIWSLPPSLRITLFIFLMISLAFLLFAIFYVVVSNRHKVIIFYLISLFISTLLIAISRTKLMYDFNPFVCDYLSLINIVPFILTILVYLKNKSPFLFSDAIYLLINISLFSFIPYYSYIASISLLYLLIRSVMIFFKAYNDNLNYPGSSAIKYALDDLNVGVIFSNTFNQIIYINKAMLDVLFSINISNYEKVNVIYDKLLKIATRKISELDFIISLNNLSYRFIITKDYKQITCFDVTYEEKLLLEEENNKAQLEKINFNLNKQLNKTDIIQKEKELLSIKGYIHDSLAQKLSVIHMFLLTDKSNDLKEIKKMLLELNLSNEFKTIDDLSYLTNLLDGIGVKLNIVGKLPTDSNNKQLYLKVIKEGTTNAIRHGNAKEIDVLIKEDELIISNDGVKKNNIVFGNGLTSIKIEAEHLGYILNISSLDKFILSIKKGD